MEKNYIDFFYTEKNFFTENDKNVSFEKYFFIQKIYIHSAKTIF